MSIIALRHAVHELRTALRRPLRSWPTHQFGISEGSLLLMMAFLVSALLGVLRQALLNAHFGVGAEINAYYAAVRLPETLNMLVTGGMLTNVMVPLLLRAERTGGVPAAHHLTNHVLSALVSFSALISGLCAIAAPAFVAYVLAPGFDAPTSQLTVILSQIMLLEVVLVVAGAALSALLTAHNQIFLPALVIASRNIILLLGIGATLLYPPLGIYGPTIGALGDGVLGIVLLLPGLRQLGFHARFTWRPRDRQLHEVIRLLVPSGLSGVVNYGGALLDTAFASWARTAAAMAAFNNAFLIIGFPVRLLGIAISQALFPRIAAQAVAAEYDTLRRTLRIALSFMLATALLVGLTLIAVSRPMIAAVFEHGAFDAAAADLTYLMLALYACGLPAYILTEMLTRTLVGLCDTRTPLLVNCLQLAARASLLAALLPTIDALALPIAYATSSGLETAMLWLAVVRRLRYSLRG